MPGKRPPPIKPDQTVGKSAQPADAFCHLMRDSNPYTFFFFQNDPMIIL